MGILSYQEFMKLAAHGESLVIDMLHCGDEHVISDSYFWKDLRKNKHKFYTKKMYGSLAYSRNMALKYSYRADRMESVGKVLEFLKQANQRCWPSLASMGRSPAGEYILKGVDP